MALKNLHPPPQTGESHQIKIVPGYEWVADLPQDKKIYLSLWADWTVEDLPPGYDYYIVSYHLEAVSVKWLQKQSKSIQGKILVLFDGNHYGLKIPNVTFISYYYWHCQIQKILSLYTPQTQTKKTHKFSAVCSRISQSKIWTTVKLLESARDDSLIILGSELELKNVHYWMLSKNSILDELTNIYRNKYINRFIKIDEFKSSNVSNQQLTSNPDQLILRDAVINFTNESFHFSWTMIENESLIYPGPFLTEKTIRCLVAGTAFVPVGQFETYKTLSQFGLKFDYGFDTSWDNDPGDITRMASVVSLIDQLNQYSIEELVQMTTKSTQHNQNLILSGEFFDNVESFNQKSIEQLFKLIS